MTYEFRCESCLFLFDVIKPVSQMDVKESCPKCTHSALRVFIPRRLYLAGTKVEEAEYNPGLGCIVRNKNHRKEICRMRGLEEIGNETPETIHKHFDRTREEKREQVWAEADKGWVGEG